MTKTLLALSLTLILGGCSLAPDYERPATPAGATWQAGTSEAAPLGWQQQFQDPALQRLIQLALDNSRDLRLSVLAVQRYEAQYRIERAAQFPGLDISASGSRSRSPSTVTGGDASISSQYSANLGVTSYELDLFGRVQNLKNQALENYLAQTQTQRSTQLALVASVADAYLNLIADSQLLALSQQTLATEQESYDLIARKQALGAASEMELAQARTSLESAKASAAQYHRLQAADRNALTLLMGSPLPADLALPSQLAEVQFAAIPVGAPSSLLTQRPDIAAAEHSLKAANANIGVARAAFYPSISLTATAGTASAELGDLFSAGSGSWSFVPSLSLPLFDFGSNQATLDVAKIDQQQAVATYEKTIQTAFQEVSDGLNAQTDYQQQLAAQQAQVEANQTYFTLADKRYQHGVDSYLTRLDAQRSLFSAQQSLVSSQLAALSNQVSLYKAIGGGWQAQAEPAK
ncbi:efflux transporter outer membrane subunit [Pseudaeromonas paramecii]|uniref:Efflux transporter outer membrane subunit n=1 Tax=Pseudaeromonas paramecii TaxID=2138166 RepID=A0ABP8QEN2_9GAMM